MRRAASSFANNFQKGRPRKWPPFTPLSQCGCLGASIAYHWQGCARVGERDRARVGDGDGTQLETEDIKLEAPPSPKRNQSGGGADGHFLPDGMSLDQYEQELIKEALRRADGNKSQAARLLGLTRNALPYRLTQMGMEA